MKINKFGAIGASALIVAALAVNASASNLPDNHIPDDDMVAYTVSEDGEILSVQAVEGVDLSDFDFSEMLVSEPEAIGEVDPDAVRYTIMETGDGKVVITTADDVSLEDIDWSAVGMDGTVSCSIVNEDGAVSVAAVYPAGDVDFSDLENVSVEGVPAAMGEIDPASVPGVAATQAKPVE